jgi:agmatinase
MDKIMTKLTAPPKRAYQTFLDFPLVEDLDAMNAHFAIIGMPYGDAYSFDEIASGQSKAPAAVRFVSDRLTQSLDRYDFDIGGTVFDGKPVKVVDVGDVWGDRNDLSGHYRRAEEAVRKILAAGAFPITIGGDHGIPIPIFRALESQGPITLVHIDAHLDWRDTFCDKREGLSSPIRRASEMGHITKIFQLGIRGQGSARPEEVEYALAQGANIITMAEWEEIGTKAVLDKIPDDGRYYLTIDMDGLEPSAVPAVMNPQPGGVSYRQTIDLIKGLTRKGRLLGVDLVELVPDKDINEISALTVGHIILNIIGAVVRSPAFRL